VWSCLIFQIKRAAQNCSLSLNPNVLIVWRCQKVRQKTDSIVSDSCVNGRVTILKNCFFIIKKICERGWGWQAEKIHIDSSHKDLGTFIIFSRNLSIDVWFLSTLDPMLINRLARLTMSTSYFSLFLDVRLCRILRPYI